MTAKEAGENLIRKFLEGFERLDKRDETDYDNGYREGQRELAKTLLRMFDINGIGITTCDKSEKIETKGEPISA